MSSPSNLGLISGSLSHESQVSLLFPGIVFVIVEEPGCWEGRTKGKRDWFQKELNPHYRITDCLKIWLEKSRISGRYGAATLRVQACYRYTMEPV